MRLCNHEDESKKFHRLFIYGTLRIGFPNHFMIDGAIFLGPARTLEKYALFSEEHPYVSKAKKISTVAGEVYRVGFPTLKYIDLFEDHPRRYKREMAPVVFQDGSITSAWIYFNPTPKGEAEKT